MTNLQNSSPQGPSHPPLALRVGIIGHRPKRLGPETEKLRKVLDEILSVVQDEVGRIGNGDNSPYQTGPGRLVAISSLAEGADQLFADSALELGFELCCVMPFTKQVFAKDFEAPSAVSPDALTRFEGLLKEAGERLTVFELDGSRAASDLAYETAGQVVVNQSDILLAVWDGERLKLRGGTEQSYDEARRQGVPVILIPAQNPEAWSVDAPLTFGSQQSASGQVKSGVANPVAIREQVRALLECSTQEAGEVSRSYGDDAEGALAGLRRFYEERHTERWSVRVWHRLTGKPLPILSQSTLVPAQSLASDSQAEEGIRALTRRLDPYFAWPDRLGILYAGLYRRTFPSVFGLAVLAVGMALLPILWHHHDVEPVAVLVEFAAITAATLLVFAGNNKHWHKRWIDYRLAAELLRSLSLVAPLGGTRPFTQLPKKGATHGQPSSTWMAWYLRAIDRELGLPNVRVRPEILLASLAHLRAAVTAQLDYHRANAPRYHHVEHRLHIWGLVFFFGTLAVCVLHFPGVLPHSVAERLTFFSAFLPALGAGLAGLKNQGEFRRLARRSHAMQEQLDRALGEVDELERRVKEGLPTAERQLSTDVAALLADWARVLVGEVLDWRVVFLDRPLEPPA